MSLLFGNLTQQFVQFGQVLVLAKQGDAAAQAALPAAAASFRHVAAQDASYLAAIGVSLIAIPFMPAI